MEESRRQLLRSIQIDIDDDRNYLTDKIIWLSKRFKDKDYELKDNEIRQLHKVSRRYIHSVKMLQDLEYNN